MHLRSCIQYDAMHLIAGNVKNSIFTMLGLLPAKSNAVVLQYDEEVNGRHRSLMRLGKKRLRLDYKPMVLNINLPQHM